MERQAEELSRSDLDTLYRLAAMPGHKWMGLRNNAKRLERNVVIDEATGGTSLPSAMHIVARQGND